MKNIQKGRFYSFIKHPAYIVWKNDYKNRYLTIMTGTTGDSHMYKLKHPTEINGKTSYINKRPFMTKRKYLGSKPLYGMKFSKEDKPLVKYVSKQKRHYYY